MRICFTEGKFKAQEIGGLPAISCPRKETSFISPYTEYVDGLVCREGERVLALSLQIPGVHRFDSSGLPSVKRLAPSDVTDFSFPRAVAFCLE